MRKATSQGAKGDHALCSSFFGLCQTNLDVESAGNAHLARNGGDEVNVFGKVRIARPLWAYDVKAAELALHKDWQDALGSKPSEFLKLAGGSTIGSATEIRSDKRGEIRAAKRLDENR